MDKFRLGSLTTDVEVTDADALLSPQVIARILAAVEEHLQNRDREAEQRRVETRISDRSGGKP